MAWAERKQSARERELSVAIIVRIVSSTMPVSAIVIAAVK
jgi:hypothetical protein